MVILATTTGSHEVPKTSAIVEGPWRIELFKSPLVVVLRHTEKRTRQTVHIDRLLPCRIPPPVVSQADSGVPTDIPWRSGINRLDTPDVDSQPLSQSWGDTDSQSQSALGSSRPVRKRRRPTALDPYILE